MSYKFKTHGTCASFIDVEMDGDKIKEEVRERLQGITCGFKDTSCADQLVHALEEAAKNGK